MVINNPQGWSPETYRSAEVVSPARQPAAWRDDAIEAEPRRRRVTVEGECHGVPDQRLDFAVEQRLGDGRRVVPARRAGRQGCRIGSSRSGPPGSGPPDIARAIQAWAGLLYPNPRRLARPLPARR